MSINELIYEYFLKPYELNQGYNLVNSLTYGVFFLGIVYLIYWILEKNNFKISNKLVYSTLPFILLGSTVRVLEDAQILPQTFFLVSPSIYIIFTIITASTLLLAHKFSKKPEKIVAGTGLILWGMSLFFYKVNNWEAFMIITTITLGITLCFGLLRKKMGLLRDNLNFLGITGHMLDATATFVTLDLYSHLGYFEQHPIPRLVGTLGGSFIWFYALKLFVIIVLYYVDKDVKNENMKKLLKLSIIILGFAPGIRDLLRLSMMV